MGTLRFAVATEDFGTPLKSAIRRAAELPVKGLRLSARSEIRNEQFGETALRQLKHYVAEHQMQVAGLTYLSRHSLSDPKHLDQRLDGIRRAMAMVRKLNTNALLIRCGRIPDPSRPEPATGPTNTDADSLTNPFSFAPTIASPTGPSPDAAFSILCEILNELCSKGNHLGCNLQLVVADYDIPSIRRLQSQVVTGPIQFVLDPATCLMTGSSAVSTYRDLYQHIGYVRARDAVRDVDGAGIEAAPGEGGVPWDELIPTLAEADFTGWVCVERTGGDCRADDVTRGVEAIRKLAPLNAH